MTKLNQIVFAFVMFALLTACSHQPTLGEKMLTQGAETSGIGKKWVDGDHLIAKGNKRIAKGQSLIKKGKSEIKAGKSMIKKGTKLKSGSEKVFHEKFPEVTLSQE